MYLVVCSSVYTIAKGVYNISDVFRDREAVFKVAQLVKNDVGPVDILVNNAGIVSGAITSNIT